MWGDQLGCNSEDYYLQWTFAQVFYLGQIFFGLSIPTKILKSSIRTSFSSPYSLLMEFSFAGRIAVWI